MGAPDTSGRPLDVHALTALERAAAGVVKPLARLWRDLAAADTTISARVLEDVLRDALANVSRLLSVPVVAVLLANDAGDELVARAAIGLSEELTLGLGIRAGQGMAGRVLSSRRPLLVGDLSAIDVVNPVLRESGLRSVAAVPLLFDSHPLGVLYAACYETDRFDPADLDLLRLVSDRLAAALDRVRLFERERESRRRAERLADRVGRMQRVTALLATVTTAEDAATALIDSIGTGEAAWSCVWLHDGDRLTPVARSGSAPGEEWAGTVSLDGDGPVAEAARDRRTVYHPGPGPAFTALPIVSGNRCAGVLVLGFDSPHQFPDDERELLATFAAQAAPALDRARLAAAQAQMAERARLFARAAQVLAEADTLADTLDRLAELAVGVLGEICLIDVVGEDGELNRLAARHRDPASQRLVDRLRTEFPLDPAGPHPAVSTIRTGRSHWSDRMSDDFLRATTISDAHLALAKALGFRSYLAVPIVAEGRVLGSVTSVSSSRSFGRDDATFAEDLAGHVAAVIDNARRYEATYRTSQILQSSLLPPEVPAVGGVTARTRYLTANRGLEVGGDFYDLLALPSGHVLFVIGDVAGHDRWAAAQMGHLRSALRALAGQVSSPGELIGAVRWSWDLLGFELIATAAVGYLEPCTGEVALASAGHYPPLLVGPGSTAFVPVAPAPPLGMPAPPAEEWRGTVRSDQVLLLYTDGAIDERSAGSDASMAQLARVAGAGETSPTAVCDRVVAMLDPHRTDDVALMALSLGPPAAFDTNRTGTNGAGTARSDTSRAGTARSDTSRAGTSRAGTARPRTAEGPDAAPLLRPGIVPP